MIGVSQPCAALREVWPRRRDAGAAGGCDAGRIRGIVPTTNPTSTALFKALIALKTRNRIIFSPHPRAHRSTNKAARLVHDAAVAAGAPAGIVGWIEEPTVEVSNALMRHPDINLTLATGGPGMVKAAYSWGKPAIGVGAGNTPAAVDEKADIKRAVASILMSKTFDNGVICASEQATVVVEVYDAVRARFIKHGGYVSVMANEYSDGQALKLLKEYLPAACKNGAADPRAREQVHNAATIAGIAFANTFLGVCHSMAHKTGAQFNIPHGSANAMLIANVVRYAEIARHLGFGGNPDTWKLHNGRRVEVEDMVSEVAPYASFLKFAGGVTFSGGEPMMQAEFVNATARDLKKRFGLHIALDTQGYLHTRVEDDWFDSFDLIMLDIKHIDPERHKALTAQALQPTLDCAARLVRLGKQVRIRYVLVPGWTDGADEIARLADYVAGLGPLVEMVEVLPFHQMGTQKWADLGIEYKLADTPTPSSEDADAARQIFRARGLTAT